MADGESKSGDAKNYVHRCILGCGRAFKTARGLSKHCHVHGSFAPFRPFCCASCGLSYSRLSNLYRHIKLKHLPANDTDIQHNEGPSVGKVATPKWSSVVINPSKVIGRLIFGGDLQTTETSVEHSNADLLQPLDHSIVKTAAGTTPSSLSFHLSSSSSSDNNSDMADTDLLRSDRLPFPGWFSDAEHSASRPGIEHDTVLTVATTAVAGIPRVAVAKELTEADAGQCRFKKDRVPETKPTSHADGPECRLHQQNYG
jgi:hypothetical protein